MDSMQCQQLCIPSSIPSHHQESKASRRAENQMYKSALRAFYLSINGWIARVHYMAAAENRMKE